MALVHCVTLVLTVLCALASAEQCVYHHVYTDDTYVTCRAGCCYSYIYPCCEDEFFYSDAFIISAAVSGGCLLIAGIVVLVVCRNQRERRRIRNQAIPTVSSGLVAPGATGHQNMYFYGNMGHPSSFPSTGGANYYPQGPPAYQNMPPSYEDCQKPTSSK